MATLHELCQRWLLVEESLTYWKKYALAAIFGMSTTLALPPYHWIPFAVIGFSGLYILLTIPQLSRKNTFWIGWWFGFGYFTTNIYWIAFALNVDMQKFGWLLVPTAMGLPSILACFVGIVGAISHSARKSPKLSEPQVYFAHLSLLAFSWMYAEWARSWVFTGLPLNLIGYIWTSCLGALQIVSYFSIYGLGFLTLLLFTLPGYMGRLYLQKIPPQKYMLFSLISLLILPFSYGYWRLYTAPETQPVYEDITIRLVQPCIPQTMKLNRAEADKVFEKHLQLSQLPSSTPLSAVIWPEVAVSFWVEYDHQRRQILQSVTPKDGLLILGGATRTPPEKTPLKVGNGVYFLDDKGNILTIYNKAHLVPFGEYMPFRSLFKKFINLDSIAAGAIDYTPGPGPRTVKPLSNFPSLSPTVCYEAIFPGEIMDSKQRAEVIINLTNDAWYGDTSGPPQNFAAAQVRAVEQGVSMIRAANNGISGVIDPYGRIVKKLELNQIGVIDSPIPKPLEKAPWAANCDYYDKTMALYYLAVILAIFSFLNGYFLDSRLRKPR